MHEDVVVLKGAAPGTLQELADRIHRPLEHAGALRAVAFGSYARGEADAWSDLDLAVVLETELPRPRPASSPSRPPRRRSRRFTTMAAPAR